MARNRAHRFWDSFTQSCRLPANLFAGGSTVMGGSDSDLAVLLEPIVLGLTFEASHGDSNEMLGNPTNLEVEELGGVLNGAVIMGELSDGEEEFESDGGAEIGGDVGAEVMVAEDEEDNNKAAVTSVDGAGVPINCDTIASTSMLVNQLSLSSPCVSVGSGSDEGGGGIVEDGAVEEEAGEIRPSEDNC
nr:hypothetical protein Iba_chr11fCG9910 [Ipomoea batatas]